MITRNITIEREGKFWLVHVDGTDGLTQARNYREAALMARQYISLVEDIPVEQVSIGTVTVQGITARLAQAADDRQRARELDAVANQTIRAVASDLRAEDVPLADIGAILGVSHQRAHQLLAA